MLILGLLMFSRKQFLLMILLVVFFLSIETPVSISSVHFFSRDDITVSDRYQCVKKIIPDDSIILFFTQVDGTLNYAIDSEKLMKLQYHVVPILVDHQVGTSFDIGNYDWLIAQGLEPKQLEIFSLQKSLEVAKICGDLTVLKRSWAK